MKKYITLMFLSFGLSFANAQEDLDLETITVAIDWNDESNKDHKYKEIYSQKDNDYIKWVYKTSKNVSGYTSDPSNTKKYYHDGRGNDPISFTVEENNTVRTEIYKNAVMPSEQKRLNKLLNLFNCQLPKITGSLPKGIPTYFSDGSKGIEMGIKTDNNYRKVKIEVLDMENNLVQIIEDKVLSEGWHNYKWDTKMIQPGQYILKYIVDGKEMTQEIEIEAHNGSLISRFFNWLF